MGFDICFLREKVGGSEVGNIGQYGRIMLGDEAEDFVSLIGFWSPLDYSRQWIRAVQRLVNDQRDSCLITSLHDPNEADVATWWL